MTPPQPGQPREAASQPVGTYSPAWRTFTKIVLPPSIRAMMHLDWAGQEHFPRRDGMILAANHLSYMDILALSLFTHSAGRYPVFLAKSSLFDVPVLGWLMRRLGQLPVYRGQVDAALVLRDAERIGKEGACVIFYPEATVTRDPDMWPMVAKTGVARLALAAGIPVVPVAHWGAQRILPYGSFLPRVLPRKIVQVLAGPPVDLSEFEGQPLTNQVLRAATDKIMADVAALLGKLRGEIPPATPFHPAVARRKFRQDLRALQETSGDPAAPADATPATAPPATAPPADAPPADAPSTAPAAGAAPAADPSGPTTDPSAPAAAAAPRADSTPTAHPVPHAVPAPGADSAAPGAGSP
jgi:1-acyl-sn-glycerol-3-phosphate acyltransferase